MGSDLSNAVPATLLKLHSVMDDFLEVSQKFDINSFQYMKYLLGVVSQAYKWCRFIYGGGLAYLLFWL